MTGRNPNTIFLPLAAILCLAPFVSSAAALVAGITLALLFGNPYSSLTKKLTPKLLSWAVVGLGAGMNLAVVGRVGLQGIAYTIVGIGLTLALGMLLGRLLRTEANTSLLITVGTAICGGSAIAAIFPVIKAKSHEVSVALGTVFLLNALALVLFPGLGHFFGLTEAQFGLWSALAIHDTSSVVGATIQYGPTAVAVGTTVKLARALWIVPLTLLLGFTRRRAGKEGSGGEPPAKRPWFILGFLLMAALFTYVPALQPAGSFVEAIAKRVLVLTLLLIGANLSREAIRSVGLRPFGQGLLLWLVTASASLGAILAGWAHP